MANDILGMRVPDTLQSAAREEYWRKGISYIFPNGTAILTALTSQMQTEKCTDQIFHWFTQDFDPRRGKVTLYSDAAMTTNYGATYTSGIGEGVVFYAKGNDGDAEKSEKLVSHFVPNMQVILRRIGNNSTKADPNVTLSAIVLGRTLDGANSQIVLRSIEADDGSAEMVSGGTTILQASNETNVVDIMPISSVFPDASGLPEAVTRDATEWTNYIQTAKTSLKLGRIAMKTYLRTGDISIQKKKESLQDHSIDIERGLIFSVKSKTRSAINGDWQYTTEGLLSFIRRWAAANGGANWGNFQADETGHAWKDYGWDWLTERMEQVFRYGSDEKWCVCGNGVLIALTRLAENIGHLNLQNGETEFGMRITKAIFPFGVINLKTHPLFNIDPMYKNAMLILEPKNLRYMTIDDTHFLPDQNFDKGGVNAISGKIEGWETDFGLQVIHPQTMGAFFGIGLNG